MGIIGRLKEQQILQDCLESKRSEFIVVYGRRRVGKTFLIKEYFDNRFAFYASGVDNVSLSEELAFFNDSLVEYENVDGVSPKNWREAFGRLKKLLKSDDVVRDPVSNKRVIFLDELPWMDTPKSGFKAALDHFWNSFASSEKDIILIVCGSATSWIIDNILSDRSGLYNRITRQIHLQPFTLGECEDLYAENGIIMSRNDMLISYMVFGGIPYYLSMLSRRMSLAQNIDAQIFSQQGELRHEYDRLFRSLFRNGNKHMEIIKALSKRRYGMTRTEIIDATGLADGNLLTKSLKELEQCGFIRKYKNYVKDKKSAYYQIIDSFTLFHLTFLDTEKISSWIQHIKTPGYYAWCGLAFEILCLNHISCIKSALGISGIESTEYAWRSQSTHPGAQIDLLIDRADNVINICEMKFSEDEYELDAEYAANLEKKISVFQKETKPKKALHLTMICANGLAQNSYSGMVVNQISKDALFSKRDV